MMRVGGYRGQDPIVSTHFPTISSSSFLENARRQFRGRKFAPPRPRSRRLREVDRGNSLPLLCEVSNAAYVSPESSRFSGIADRFLSSASTFLLTLDSIKSHNPPGISSQNQCSGEIF